MSSDFISISAFIANLLSSVLVLSTEKKIHNLKVESYVSFSRNF